AGSDALVLRATRLYGRCVLEQGEPLPPDGRTARRLPSRVFLRRESLDRVDALGTRRAPLPVRPQLGRPALGACGSSLTSGRARRSLVAAAGFPLVCQPVEPPGMPDSTLTTLKSLSTYTVTGVPFDPTMCAS